MSSLTYNPNIEISPYHIQEQTNTNIMDFPNDGNYKPIPLQPNVQPNVQPIQYNSRVEMISSPPVYQQVPQIKSNIKQPQINEEFTNKKIDWILFIKKLVIYSMLFLIMSHVKMNTIVCNFIPYLNNNEILCMVTKSVIIALLIIIIQLIL